MNKKSLKIIIPTIFLLIMLTITTIILWPKKVTVPDLAGLTLQGAYDILPDNEISQTEVYNYTIPKGGIISQSIEPGTKIGKNDKIEIVISKGIEQVSVPNILDKTLEEATKTFLAAGLKIDSTIAYSDTVVKNNIVSQSTEPNTLINIGSTVSVVVSKGSEYVLAPNMLGKTLNEAKQILLDLDAGLKIDHTAMFSDTVAENNIISQSAEPNTRIKAESTVSIVISKGVANVYGNTASNIHNEGRAAQQGNWIFYSANSDLYKIRIDGTEKTKLNIDKSVCGFVNVVADWIYFTDYSNGVYKVRIDGTDLTKILSVQIDYMIVVGDYIYYNKIEQNGMSGPIYKIHTDGKGKTQITDEATHSFSVVGDWIYYNSYNSQNDSHDLFKIRTDGTDRTFLKADTGFLYVIAEDDVIYCDIDAFLYKIDMNDLSQQTKLNDYFQRINVFGDQIYCIDNRLDDKTNNFHIIKKDGTGKKTLPIKNCVAVNVVDGWIFYRINASTELYKIRIDGTDNQLLG